MQSSHRSVAILGLLLALLNTAASCSKKPSGDPIKETTEESNQDMSQHDPGKKLTRHVPTLEDVEFPEDLSDPTELSVLLTPGKATSEEDASGNKTVKGTKLDLAATKALLERAEPLQAEEGDQVDFAKRERSLPPPKKIDVVQTQFPSTTELAPPDAQASEDANAPLKILRQAPTGDVPIVPQVSVTFNQPMVAVSSIAEIDRQALPVTLEPKVEGQWRWVGTKTLLFEPSEERLPMATTYTLQLKNDVTSKLGNALAEGEETRFEFKTPPVQVKRFWPDSHRTMPRDQVMFLEFDQRIDQEAMLDFIRIKGGLVFGTRTPMLATADDIDRDEELQKIIAQAKPGQWLAIKAETELPYDSNISVTLKKGAPSAEGPLLTSETQSFDFRTFGPLNIDDHRCGWRDCTPHDTFSFTFSNELDQKQDLDALITVEPSFPGMSISHYGQHLNIQGQKPGRKTYTVTFADELKDRFGQKLEGKKTFSFKVGAERPWLSGAGDSMLVLDPSSDPGYTLFSMNIAEIQLKVYEVDPGSDWGGFLTWMNDWSWRGKHEVKPPGKLVKDETLKISGDPDVMAQTIIDLNAALGGDKLGHAVIEVRPTKAMKGSKLEEERYRPRIRKWVQATQIGLDALVDYEQLVGMATSLKSGEPMSGVTLSLSNHESKLTSDAKGMATFELSTGSAENNVMLAQKGKDVAMLPESTWNNRYTSWRHNKPGDNVQFFIFDDRGMYRPGEEVHVKGWARIQENTKGGSIALPEGARKINYIVYGSQNNEITRGEAAVTPLGGFDFAFSLPTTPNLGYARIEMTIEGARVYGSTSHTFQIQEFRRPEFQVSASAPEGPFFAGEEATVNVSASYYAGGALPGAQTTWVVTKTQSSYSPPNQSKYTFGSWVPWWAAHSYGVSSPTESERFEGKTDVTGEHLLKLEFGLSSPPRPVTVQAQATVQDVNRQASTSSASLLVHPSMHYVGIRTEKYFVEKGEPLKVYSIITDLDGNILKDRPLKVRAARVKYSWKNGEYKEELVDPQLCEVNTTDSEAVCEFKTSVGGTYKITATTLDDYGRGNFSEMTRWVSGGARPVSRKVEQEKVELIPDQDNYQPGQKARVLVQSPFTPAEGILTINRNGILEQRRFTLSEPTKTFEVPIKSAHVPNLHVQVDLVGSAPRLDEEGQADESLPRRPAYATGQINLPVPPLERTLAVEVAPATERIEPGGKTTVSVQVKDASGKPVQDAEVALVLVDESILALSHYTMSDPVSFFYPTRPSGVQGHHLRQFVSLIDPAQLRQQQSPPQDESLRDYEGAATPKRKSSRGAAPPSPSAAAPGMMAKGEASVGGLADNMMMAEMAVDEDSFADGVGGGGAQNNGPIAVRSNFNPLAGFFPAVKTDTGGKATIDVQMPDNLTRYRVMAVAVSGGKYFGESQSHITARLPLMVRPSAPRFLNFGDKFELPVVLQNQTDDPMSVQIATAATNVELIDGQGYTVQVPANDRVEVRFPATTAMAGTARFQIVASSGKWQDASKFDLPVWTPATSEAFATYGVIDQGTMTQPVKTPGEVWPQFGQVEVSTSSTAMQELTDAFLYLYHYDYQCAEQISSRVLSVAALRDVLKAFNTEEMPSDDDIRRSMERDMDELGSRQNYDGGFGLWRRGQPSWPYVSLHAAHAITRAEQKGYSIKTINKPQMLRYLKDIENYIPHYYTKRTRDHISAYALYVRGLNGDRDTIKARALIKSVSKLDDLTFESLGWLLGVLTGDPDSASQLKELRRFIGNRVTETAGAAHFASSIDDDQGYLIMHSNRVADGIILEAMIEDEPKSDLIPKIVKGLLAHRKKGRWSNTQENAFVLLALDKYFNTYEKETPDFVARVWLGDTYAGDHKYKGRTIEQHQIDIPMSYLVKQGGSGEQPLIIQKDGKKGRLYYRVGMTYAPKSLALDPMDQGFVVERAYEPVDNDEDVKRLADGTWQIKAGAKVRIRLTMVAPTRRYHVALVDPLPAGLETLNPALATTEDVPQDPAMSTGRGWWWWSRPWFEHQNMRDERTEAFTTLLWGGVHRYTYYARATTPGEFVVPPAKAEEMYHPETFGRSSTDKVQIID